MNYFEFTFFTKNLPEISEEIIISELDRLGFEGIVQEEGKIIAYIRDSVISNSEVSDIQKLFIYDLPIIKYEHKIIKEKNWNEVWESNFEPVIVKNKCIIHAPFHQNLPKCDLEIIIEPKMSFGTGHHETTILMIEELLEMDLKDKIILDMGCGTGILTILISKLKAKQVIAVDNGKWAYQNAKENCIKNNVSNVRVLLSDISQVSEMKFDIILSNISKNINLEYLAFYSELLNKDGFLLLSGFYKEDITEIREKAKSLKLTYLHSDSRKNWALVKFIRK